MIPGIASSSAQEHATTIDTLLGVEGIANVVIASRPSQRPLLGFRNVVRLPDQSVCGWLEERKTGNICCRVQVTCWPGGYPDAMPGMPHSLTAALHREEDWFIAQCLEVDVASQGHTIGQALAGLAEAVELYLEEADDPAGHVTARD